MRHRKGQKVLVHKIVFKNVFKIYGIFPVFHRLFYKPKQHFAFEKRKHILEYCEETHTVINICAFLARHVVKYYFRKLKENIETVLILAIYEFLPREQCLN